MFIAMLLVRYSAAPDETSYGAHQFRRALILFASLASNHTMASVVVEQPQGHFVERGLYRADLRENVNAVAVFFYHTIQAPHLPLDALEAVQKRFLLGCIAVCFGRCHSCCL